MSALPDPGDRVELVHTDDEYTLLEPGARGTVALVSDVPWPTVHVRWDDGSTLSLIPSAGDRFRAVTE